MAEGQLYVKTAKTNDWVDTYVEYGLSLEDGSLSRLMAPSPNKQAVRNSNVASHGASILQSTFYKDVRQVSLEVHIVAPDSKTFLRYYKNFCSQVLDCGLILIKHSSDPLQIYHFLYVDCTQFAQYGMELAKFTLSLEEPHPEVRTGESLTI